MVEIDCPPDCVYLKSGQTYRWVKKYVSQLQQEKDPVKRRKLYETTQKFGSLLSEIEKAIVSYASDLRSLKDELILEAVALVKETYQTENKGLIYEHTSTNPLVQGLVRNLLKFLENQRSNQDGDFRNVTAENLISCMEVMESDIHYHLEKDSDETSYLTFIKRNHPDTVSAQSSGGNLIQI